MNSITVTQLIPVLQTSIGPVILISGVALLLLTMTNRLSRTIERARILSEELHSATEITHPTLSEQLAILWKRAKLIQASIALASMSALSAAFLIIVIFLTALSQAQAPWLISGLFITCMLSLISSLLVFIYDINLTLAALKLELGADSTRKP